MLTGKGGLVFVLFVLPLLLAYAVDQTRAHRRIKPIVDSGDRVTVLGAQEILSLHPELNVFFHFGELKRGTRIPVYFTVKDPSKQSRFLSKEQSDSIPFSFERLSEILDLFDLPASSQQAVAVKATLRHCDTPPLRGETKFCVSSLESLLGMLVRVFASETDSDFRILTTIPPSAKIPVLQNYTVAATPVVVRAKRIIGCHKMPYPYAVFYCHGQSSGEDEVYRVSLIGDDGSGVEAVAVCHMDTSQWDPNHVAFRVMRTEPGSSPICHFFQPDNLVWFKP